MCSITLSSHRNGFYCIEKSGNLLLIHYLLRLSLVVLIKPARTPENDVVTYILRGTYFVPDYFCFGITDTILMSEWTEDRVDWWVMFRKVSESRVVDIWGQKSTTWEAELETFYIQLTGHKLFNKASFPRWADGWLSCPLPSLIHQTAHCQSQSHTLPPLCHSQLELRFLVRLAAVLTSKARLFFSPTD